MSHGRVAYLLASPTISPAECSRLVESSEAHAAAVGGWSTARHTTVPTTDFEVRAEPSVLAAFNRACEQTVFPALEALYPGGGSGERAAPAVCASAVRVSDAFVVRYEAGKQAGLPVHADDSHFSLTLALNPKAEYRGGGTWFEDLDEAVRPDCGQAVVFPGSLRHAGLEVVEGVRYVIVAFLWVEGYAPPRCWTAGQ